MINVYHGEDLKILKDANPSVLIAAAKSCEIHVQSELIPIASKSSNNAYRAGRTDWTVTIGHLVTADTTPMVGGKYKLSIVIGGTSREGEAICESADLSGQVHHLAQGSASFRGIEPLT